MQMSLRRGGGGYLSLAEARLADRRGAGRLVADSVAYTDEYASIWIGRALLMHRVFSQAYLSAS